MIDGVTTNRTAETVSSFDSSLATHGTSVQYKFAMLQAELAKENKVGAEELIEQIESSQEFTKDCSEVANAMRDLSLKDESLLTNLPTSLEAVQAELENTDPNANAERYAVLQDLEVIYSNPNVLEEANVTMSSTLTSDSLKNMISSVEASQESASSAIQQQMLLAQDYIGQYNSYTQGASSAISSAAETLKTVARG